MNERIAESYNKRVFLAMLGFALVILTLLGAMISAVFIRYYRNDVESEACRNAANLSRTLSGTVADAAASALALTDDPVIRRLFAEKLTADEHSRLETEARRELYLVRNTMIDGAEAHVISRKNQLWIATGGAAYKMPDETGHWGIFRKADETEGVAVYATMRDFLLDEESRIAIAHAVREGDGVSGYILFEIPRASLDYMAQEHQSRFHTEILMVNTEGSVIYHSGGRALEGLGMLAPYGEFRELTEMPPGGENAVWNNCAFAFNENAGLYILIELPSNILSGIWRNLLWITVLAMAVIVLLSTVVSWWLSRAIAKPVEALMRDMNEKNHSLWVAETRSLNLQMNPHFLYNTLDLIKWSAKLGRTDEVAEIVVALGKLLRRIMNEQNDIVPLSLELEIVTAFVEIQKKHFGERLTLETSFAPGLPAERIPKLTIQPMIENAIVHGFAHQETACRITLKGWREGEYLLFLIADNGEGIPADVLPDILSFREGSSHHIGLGNVQRRAVLYGDETCGLSVESRKGEGTEVRLRLKRGVQ